MQGVLPAILIFCVGCSEKEAGTVSAASEAYCREGAFTDLGSKLAANRHVLKLGEVDFSAKRERIFRMAGLPEARFWIGFSPQGSVKGVPASLEVRGGAEGPVSRVSELVFDPVLR